MTEDLRRHRSCAHDLGQRWKLLSVIVLAFQVVACDRGDRAAEGGAVTTQKSSSREPPKEALADSGNTDLRVQGVRVELLSAHRGWVSGGRSVVAEPIESIESALLQREVAECISRYQPFRVDRVVRRIVVAGAVSIDATDVGGTYIAGERTAIVALSKSDPSGVGIARRLHAELSSLFLRRYPDRFDRSEWLATSGKDEYRFRDGLDAIRGGAAG